MRVIHREVARAQQAVQLAALFKTINRAKFSQAQRQISIGAHLMLKDLNVVWAVHWLENICVVADIIICLLQNDTRRAAAIMRLLRPCIPLACLSIFLKHRWVDAVAVLIPVPARLIQP